MTKFVILVKGKARRKNLLDQLSRTSQTAAHDVGGVNLDVGTATGSYDYMIQGEVTNISDVDTISNRIKALNDVDDLASYSESD